MVSEKTKIMNALIKVKIEVLILVLMEYGLWVTGDYVEELFNETS